MRGEIPPSVATKSFREDFLLPVSQQGSQLLAHELPRLLVGFGQGKGEAFERFS